MAVIVLTAPHKSFQLSVSSPYVVVKMWRMYWIRISMQEASGLIINWIKHLGLKSGAINLNVVPNWLKLIKLSEQIGNEYCFRKILIVFSQCLRLELLNCSNFGHAASGNKSVAFKTKITLIACAAHPKELSNCCER